MRTMKARPCSRYDCTRAEQAVRSSLHSCPARSTIWPPPFGRLGPVVVSANGVGPREDLDDNIRRHDELHAPAACADQGTFVPEGVEACGVRRLSAYSEQRKQRRCSVLWSLDDTAV